MYHRAEQAWSLCHMLKHHHWKNSSVPRYQKIFNDFTLKTRKTFQWTKLGKPKLGEHFFRIENKLSKKSSVNRTMPECPKAALYACKTLILFFLKLKRRPFRTPISNSRTVMRQSWCNYLFGSKWAKHGASVICFFSLSKSSSISDFHSQLTSFFRSFLILSVFIDRLFINFERCWIEPKKDFNSLTFFGASSLVIAYLLSLIGFTPSWLI